MHFKLQQDSVVSFNRVQINLDLIPLFMWGVMPYETYEFH